MTGVAGGCTQGGVSRDVQGGIYRVVHTRHIHHGTYPAYTPWDTYLVYIWDTTWYTPGIYTTWYTPGIPTMVHTVGIPTMVHTVGIPTGEVNHLGYPPERLTTWDTHLQTLGETSAQTPLFSLGKPLRRHLCSP